MYDRYANNRMVYQALLDLGVPPRTAIGAVGSLMGESGRFLRNDARNPGDGRNGGDSIGWGQWNEDRAAALMKVAEQNKSTWSDPKVMTQHIRNELTGPYKGVLDKLKAKDDEAHGTSVWTRFYEVPKDPDGTIPQRLQNARMFAQEGLGNPPGGYTAAGGLDSPRDRGNLPPQYSGWGGQDSPREMSGATPSGLLGENSATPPADQNQKKPDWMGALATAAQFAGLLGDKQEAPNMDLWRMNPGQVHRPKGGEALTLSSPKYSFLNKNPNRFLKDF